MIRTAPVLALLLSACEAPASDPVMLPEGLREISGLAAAGPGRVFAHDDEQAIVHEIEVASGRVVRSFGLGDPPARGDFEGIAAEGARVHLVTSDGRLWTAMAGEDGARVRFDVRETGADCEVEGLSLAPQPGELLILCKEVRGAAGSRLRIYRWRLGSNERVETPWLDIDLSALLGDDRRFAPSAIEWIAGRRQLVVASARDRMLMVLDEAGTIIASAPLAATDHRQPEGLASVDGNLLVADEGSRRQPGTITIVPIPTP